MEEFVGVVYQDEDGLLDLDALYPRALPGSWIVLSKHNYSELYRITRSVPAARTDFTLTGRVTRLELDAREHLSWFPRRGTVVYLESEELSLTAAPDRTLLGGNVIELEGVVEGLEEGRSLIVSGYRRRVRVDDAAGALMLVAEDGSEERLAPGEVLWMLGTSEEVGDSFRWMLRSRAGREGRVDAAPGEIVEMAPNEEEDTLLSEVITLERATSDGVRTTLELTDPLTRWYDRGTTWLWGNVAAATHGETVREVLGSGDGSRTHQTMELKRVPLTYVSAASASSEPPPKASALTAAIVTIELCSNERNSAWVSASASFMASIAWCQAAGLAGASGATGPPAWPKGATSCGSKPSRMRSAMRAAMPWPLGGISHTSWSR